MTHAARPYEEARGVTSTWYRVSLQDNGHMDARQGREDGGLVPLFAPLGYSYV